jgi:ATP-dependent helicase/nuclease subunit A
MDDASRAQVAAAAPDVSTWLSANAGSGKTRVLTDRVARLLLAGTAPERILCLTYTKAAAMEMQNRLFERLGAWAMLSDADLRATLADVGVEGLTDAVLARARTLFARAIEAPGGLKIQTIHSFCSSVLRRFPLEAGVSPGFTEIDERVQARLMADVLDTAARGDAGAAAIDGLARHLGSDDGLAQVAKRVLDLADAFEAPWDWAAICEWAGLPPGLSEADITAAVVTGDERALAAQIVTHLDLTKSPQAKLAERLQAMPWEAMTLEAMRNLEAACLTMSGPKAGQPSSLANASVRDAMGPALVTAYADLAARVADARPLRLAYQTAKRTDALHRFADVFLPAYRAAKDLRGYLDFDDLINRTRRLLAAPGVAQWVLFRLDGGIDHILVDEAQDTSPAQWDIVSQLAEDFASGEGARADVQRTVFVVGDKKQSIYSFQGADPAEFDRMRARFAERLAQIEQPLAQRELIYSFRSSPVILDLVDAVAGGAGAPGVGPDVRHRAFFDDMPGRVDLWPVMEADTAKPDEVAWDDPVDLVSSDHHSNRLAQAIAAHIEVMLTDGVPITVAGTRRAVEAGDILILLRGRSRNQQLFAKIINEIKKRNLPIAGFDRTHMRDPLAVKDLVSLLRFLATPEDDLSLAEVLRSPIGGWNEDALFRLAQPRREGEYLWRALQDHAADYPQTVAMLGDLRDSADFMRPYDLLERVLIRWGARERMVARLGPEAEDAIDALLTQALSFEALEVPSLTGFIGWMESGEVVVKRDLAKPNGQIRVMTMHGAKGLEAPVVILPDCGTHRAGGARGVRLVTPENGPVAWAGTQSDVIAPVQAALEAEAIAEAEETNRLLYVGMTRAESWLIVAAAGQVGKAPESSWYNAVAEGMAKLGAQPLSVPDAPGDGLRLERGDWSALPVAPGTEAAPVAVPDWLAKPAPPMKRAPAMLTPSDLGGAKAIFEEGAAQDEAAALRRGRLVHLLLEHLPHLPQAAWPAAAPGIWQPFPSPMRPSMPKCASPTSPSLSISGPNGAAPASRSAPRWRNFRPSMTAR